MATSSSPSRYKAGDDGRQCSWPSCAALVPAGLWSTCGSWGEISDLFPLCSNSSPSGFLYRPISCHHPALPVCSLGCEHKCHCCTRVLRDTKMWYALSCPRCILSVTNISAAELAIVPPPLSPLASTRTQHCLPLYMYFGIFISLGHCHHHR